MVKFRKLEVESWRQFRSVEVEFHEKATIITGANGSGKTTLLSILSQHFGWSPDFIGTLRIDRRGALKYFSGFSSDVPEGNAKVGTLTYDDESVATLSAPIEGETVKVTMRNAAQVPGIYITSHRPVYSYQKVTEVPTEVQAGRVLFDQYVNDMRSFYLPRSRTISPSHRLKAALISLAVFGPGNDVIARNDEARETFEGFQDALVRVMPESIGFRRFSIAMPEVILETAAGNFSLDAASGGIAALVDISWQIYMRSRTDDTFAVVIDEPENHLHPSLQRSVLPGLIAAFPQTQFIVATHNPFVVTSVRDSNVVVLDFMDGRVGSTRLQDVDRSASANRVLTDVLGVPFPAPLWVENELENIVASVGDKELTTELISSVREQLGDLGLRHLFPDVIDRLLPTEGAVEDGEK